MQNLVLIVAAGRGNRFGGELPKQYQPLDGRPLLAQSIEAFLKHPRIDKVRVVICAGDEKMYNDIVRDLKSKKLLPPVIGGAERQDSVRLGLESMKELKPENVLIHDAARPYVSAAVINNVLAGLEKHQAVIPVIAAADSARYDGGPIERGRLKLVQTPQGFRYEMILRAHQQASGIKHQVSDDAQVAEVVGVKIYFVEGDAMNKKVTVKNDLIPDTCQLTPRIGMGFDVHEFETGTHVTICGVKIPHTHQLKGHSDADVGLHALTDAILGAMGAGDIGEHFPPSDMQWCNADSSMFVRHALKHMRQKNGEIGNIDITIICEEPKLVSYKPAMREYVAQLLEITPDCVNIKATTTEGLGFTGRKEGIAAQAVAAIRFLG